MVQGSVAMLVLLGSARGWSWQECRVTDHGGIGDGVTLNTAAFAAAIKACSGGGTIVVPSGETPSSSRFLTGPFNLTSNTALEIQAGASILGTNYTTVQLPPLPSMGGSVAAGGGGGAGRNCRYSPLIGASHATNVSIFGAGIIDGQGQPFWNYDKRPCRKPMLIEFWYVAGLEISGVHIRNSPFWTVHPYMSENIHIHHVNITDDTPANAHWNVDGIDPDSCTNVLIEDYHYCGGDDAIAIKSGWNIAGVLYGKPSRNITVRRSSAGCRGGWTIGSEAHGGVQDVLFEDLTSTAQSGIRISAELDRGGFVHNVTFRNLLFKWDRYDRPNNNSKKAFLINVEQTYSNGGTYPPCVGCPIPTLTPNQTLPDFNGIYFDNITVVRAPSGLPVGTFNCSQKPCQNIQLSGIKVLNAPSPQPLSCTGVHGTQDGVDASIIPANCVQSSQSKVATIA